MKNVSKNYLDAKSIVLFNITKKDNLFLDTKNIKYYFIYLSIE